MIEKKIDYIDDPKDTYEQYLNKAIQYDFRCIFSRPELISTAKTLLKGCNIIIAGAVDFPGGVMSLEEKLDRFSVYAQSGFHEIDYVLNQERIEQQDFDAIYEEMMEVHAFCLEHGIREKAIVEMCKLDWNGKKRVCEIARKVKPAFLKTSTGKSFKGAEIDDVKLMKQILQDEVQIKAAGGIKTYEQAIAFIDAGADVLGASAGIAIVEGEKSRLH